MKAYQILLAVSAVLFLSGLSDGYNLDHVIKSKSPNLRYSVAPYDEPGYAIYEQMLGWIASNAGKVVDIYATALEHTHPGQGDALRSEMLDLLAENPRDVEVFEEVLEERMKPENTTCNVCRALFGTLVGLVRNGSDYESIKNATMEICYLIVPVEGWNPDTLCELALDTYAPHVIYVLNTTDHTPEYFCQYYNFCPGGVPPPNNMPRLSANQEQPNKELRHESGFSNPIRVLHFTDAHIDHEYDVGAPLYCDMPLCCREEYNGTGAGKDWGDYKCNIPPKTADHFFAKILTQFSPDLILYTGDTTQHTVWDQPLDNTIYGDKWLSDQLWHFFPGIPAYNALGNHDVTPTNLYYVQRPEIQEINAAQFDHWKSLSKLTEPHQRETMLKGVYYTASPFPGLRILAYNSEYGALDNFYSILLYDEPEYVEMLQWMSDTLAAAEANGEKVIMLGHRPTGGSNKTPGYNRFINDLQSRYGDTVILHLLGHNHDDKFALVRDFSTGVTRGVQISSPSMTSYTDTNPSIRFFYLDPQTYQPLDMETYRIDLAADGDASNPQLKLTYSMTGDYGLADATAESFEELTNKLETDDALFDEFMFNVETATGFNRPCTGSCRANMLCDLRNSDAELRQECRDNIPL